MGISTRKARLIRDGFRQAQEFHRMYRNLYLNPRLFNEYKLKATKRAGKIYNVTTWRAFHRKVEELSGQRRRLY